MGFHLKPMWQSLTPLRRLQQRINILMPQDGMPTSCPSKRLEENNSPRARRLLNPISAPPEEPRLMMMTTMTLIFLAQTMMKKKPKLPKLEKNVWLLMQPKKSKKPALIAKTSVLLDVKPWDDETDMDEVLKSVKTIEMEGLVWGANKLVPIGYGIKKLQVMCVVEDEKVSIDELQEKICEFEDFVQSCDVAAMNKI